MKCEVCNSEEVWTCGRYLKLSLGRVTCSSCGVKNGLKRELQYWVWVLLFMIGLFPLSAIFSNIVFYVSEGHPEAFHHSFFKLGFSIFCGSLVFLAFIFPDKYFLYRWGSLRANTT